MFDFSNYSTKSKYCDNWNKLVIDKMKDDTAGVAIKERFGLKPKMYSFLVRDNGEHKKAKNMITNVVTAISHSEYRDVVLNNRPQNRNIWIHFFCLVLTTKYISKTMGMTD